MSNQNKIISLRNLDRVGQPNQTQGNKPSADDLASVIQQYSQIQQYVKNGLEYITNGEYVTPAGKPINQRNEGGEFILIESTADFGVDNQNYFIESNYEQFQNKSINDNIDTQFKYFKFPPTVTVTPITEITAPEIDLEINDDLKAYSDAVLEALAANAAAQEAAQEDGGTQEGSGNGFSIINVTDNIYLSFNYIIREYNTQAPILFPAEQILRTGFNWPDNKFLGESESALQKIAGTAAILAVGGAVGGAIGGALFFAPVVGILSAPAAGLVGGALVGLVANGGLKTDKNYVTISYELSGQYETGVDENGSPYGLRALFVRGSSDSALTGKDLYNKAKQADKDKNYKRLNSDLRTVSGVDDNGETASVTYGYIQIQSPTNKYEDDYYLIIEVGTGADAKDFTGIEGTRTVLGPITTVKAKVKDKDGKTKLEIKNKNNSDPDFEYINTFSI
jgi:hypothetical protein